MPRSLDQGLWSVPKKSVFQMKYFYILSIFEKYFFQRYVIWDKILQAMF